MCTGVTWCFHGQKQPFGVTAEVKRFFCTTEGWRDTWARCRNWVSMLLRMSHVRSFMYSTDVSHMRSVFEVFCLPVSSSAPAESDVTVTSNVNKSNMHQSLCWLSLILILVHNLRATDSVNSIKFRPAVQTQEHGEKEETKRKSYILTWWTIKNRIRT